MPTWEYCKIDLVDMRRMPAIDVLNNLGRDGWELIALTVNNIAYLKRQVRSERLHGRAENAAAARGVRSEAR